MSTGSWVPDQYQFLMRFLMFFFCLKVPEGLAIIA